MMQKMGDNLEEGGKSALHHLQLQSLRKKTLYLRDDKEGKSLKKESVMNSYRQMWEGAVEENIERGYHEKNAKRKSPKGMPR